jgi:hypothetical protein
VPVLPHQHYLILVHAHDSDRSTVLDDFARSAMTVVGFHLVDTELENLPFEDRP